MRSQDRDGRAAKRKRYIRLEEFRSVKAKGASSAPPKQELAAPRRGYAADAHPPYAPLKTKVPNRGISSGQSPLAAFAPQFRRKTFHPKLLILAVIAAAMITGAVFGVAALLSRPRLVAAQEVVFDGRTIGIVKSQQDAAQAMEQIRTDLKTTYSMELAASQQLSYTAVLADPQNICSKAQMLQAIKQNIDVKVLASVIQVNDRPAVALHTKAEAQTVLDDVLQPFRDAPSERNRTDIAFVENVAIVDMPIDYSMVCAEEQAVRILSMGAGVEDNWYEAKKGDSLARIAKKFKLKISDLRRANPSLAATDVIQPGDRVNAVKPNKWVNVRFTETVTREEALPYKTVEQTDETLYTTQKNVKQEGKKGRREVVAQITYINGMEAQEDVMSETVLTPALDRIVLKGTKKVPVNLDDNGSNGGKPTAKPGSNGGTTSASGYSLPLKDYRLTSTFRVRTLQGVTRWHYGVDLAAPTGTPIYAAKSGTVSYSGASSGYGLLMELDHGGGVRTRYGHCSKLLVKKGQQVKKGQIIALVGSTGHSTGPHCHFEIRVNGKAVNPEKYVTVRH